MLHFRKYCIYFIPVLYLAGHSTVAQDRNQPVELTWGSEEILPSSQVMPKIEGHDENGFYTLSYDYRWAIEHFDEDLNHTGKEYLKMYDNLRTREIEALVHFHDVLYLFTSETRMNHRILYVETIDKETLKQRGDRKIFKEVAHMSGWFADFGFELSKKENKLLIYSKIIAYWQKYQVLEWGVYGPRLQEEWSASDRIKYNRVPRDESGFGVDERGNAFMVNLYWDPRLFERLKPQKNIYQIITRTNKGESFSEYFVDFKGKFIRGIGLESDDDRTLAVVGFYSPVLFRTWVNGIFFFNIDMENNVIRDRKFHEFDKFFLTEAMSLKKNNRYEELISFSLDYFVRRKNGNYLMAAQQIYDQNYDTYNNIIFVCLAPDGEILWDRTIEKKQNHNMQEKFNPSSYTMLAPFDQSKVDIIYNEHLKNLNRPEDKKYRNFGLNTRSYLNHIEIGPYGEMAENELYLKTKKRMLTPLPVMAYDMKNHELVIPARRWRKFRFVKISFREEASAVGLSDKP